MSLNPSPSGSLQNFVTFNGWTQGNHNIGHFSYTYGQKQPDGQVLWSRYHSIQPQNSWASNPFSCVSTYPLKAQSVGSMQDDARFEASRRGGPQMPDCQYTFPITTDQLQEIDTYTNISEQQITNGQERYTYLPGFPAVTRFIQAAAWLPSHDDLPPTGLESEVIPPLEIKHSHCVTKVRDVARDILHLPLSPPHPFYVATPRQFREDLEEIAKRTPGASFVKTAYNSSVEQQLDEVPI